MTKPLGLPVGSVRALLLLGLGAAAVLFLRRTHDTPPVWLLAALVVSASAYFASRHSPWRAAAVPGAGMVATKPPLGFPAGFVRFVFLALVGYGTWLWSKDHKLTPSEQPVVLVIAGFYIGVMVGFFMSQVRRPDDPSTLFFDHLQAISALVCGGGLVWLAAQGQTGADVSPWTEPALAAVCTYYAGVR